MGSSEVLCNKGLHGNRPWVTVPRSVTTGPQAARSCGPTLHSHIGDRRSEWDPLGSCFLWIPSGARKPYMGVEGGKLASARPEIIPRCPPMR